VRKIVDFYKINPAVQLLVLCDDIDLPLGETRLRLTGGPGTHNALKSIVATLGEAFPRLRIGLGSPAAGTDLAAWVLSVPTQEERRTLGATIATIPDKVKAYILQATPES